MAEFDKWFANIKKEYPLYQDRDGYNIGNVPALKAGWRAALEWVLSLKEFDHTDIFEVINPILIEKELREE